MCCSRCVCGCRCRHGEIPRLIVCHSDFVKNKWHSAHINLFPYFNANNISRRTITACHLPLSHTQAICFFLKCSDRFILLYKLFIFISKKAQTKCAETSMWHTFDYGMRIIMIVMQCNVGILTITDAAQYAIARESMLKTSKFRQQQHQTDTLYYGYFE